MLRASSFAAAILLLYGCISAHGKFDRDASGFAFERSEVDGLGFRHAVYKKSAPPHGDAGPVHVYLTGDGLPYIRPGLASGDPTPRRPVVPSLLALDPEPGIILGRPCYHGYAHTPPCSQRLWTHARYGEEVVASMNKALARAVPAGREMVLIGFSGGGALAMLLSGRVPGIVAVVTLAGNLDIDAWADAHGYERLRGSMNPVAAPALPAELIQLHCAGADDERVSPKLLKRASKRTGGELFVLQGVTHNRGWERHWPAILEELNRRLDGRM